MFHRCVATRSLGLGRPVKEDAANGGLERQGSLLASAPISSRTVDPLTNWRWYEFEGNKYISVTQVLDSVPAPYLKKYWIKNTPEEIEKRKTETAGQGSSLHAQSHAGKEDRLNLLLEELKMETIASEVVVVSKNGWAGQADRFVQYQGKRWVIDIKTGGHGIVAFQMAAYSLAANERGANIEAMGVINLPRDLTKPATFSPYGYLETNQYRWCALFDAWKGLPWVYKSLLDWPFFKSYAVLNYNWSFGGPHEEKV